MVSKRVLLFGGDGQVGRAVRARVLPAGWELGVSTRAQCDLTRAGDIAKAIRDFAPDIVINAAAIADIDTCERDYALAMRVNFEAVAEMAAHCAEANAPLIQISTDYVFDGSEGERPYATDDAMNPLNTYGKSKLMGEEAARHGIHWHVILRTSSVFGAWGQNILTKTLHSIDTLDEFGAVTDQISCPTSADAVAEALVVMADAILGGKVDGFGTFHLCGAPPVSRYDFLQAMIDAYAPYTGRRTKLVPLRAADIAGRVPRPAYSVLDCGKIQRVYGIAQRPWREDLITAIKTYMENRADV
ncbi:MAG: dTDP-4-dehydrorhamnose reductase [Alphaproteobacteria bacterium]|nr:dTDP-4-dehydrorhamnose reductase [Alphaproteobacteria bacterium]